MLEQDLYSLGGEALVLVYPRQEGRVTSIVGQGWAPAAVNVDWYLSRNVLTADCDAPAHAITVRVLL